MDTDGGASCNGQYMEAPPERGIGISQVGAYEKIRKSVIQLFLRAFS